MSGPLPQIRQRPMTTSGAWNFYHFAKTNKSAINNIIDIGAVEFELHVNHTALQKVFEGEVAAEDTPLTYTYIPGASPEELVAQRDAEQAASEIVLMSVLQFPFTCSLAAVGAGVARARGGVSV